jgi:prepilin-type N-terminal cleavage/methylation domain-containing protein
MSRLVARARRAFTIVEILVAIVLLGIIGGALVRLIIVQSQFTEKQMAARNARAVSRNAMNIMLTDLRMVQDNNGLLGASNDSVTVRVPLAFGLFCARVSGIVTLSLLPVDSAMAALGEYGGWAYRDSTLETYSYADANTPISFNSMTSGVGTVCSNAVGGPGISQVSYQGRTGRVVQTTDGPTGTPIGGWPVFVYQTVTYRFQTSSAFPGRLGLFRKVKTGSTTATVDEIIAPFDTSAKFRYYVLNADTAQTAVPADLNTVRGLQLYLAGSSPRIPQSGTATQAALVTGVFFKNRRDP